MVKTLNLRLLNYYIYSLKNKVNEIKSFAKRLNKDYDAVENVVAYDFSNGFVETLNSKLKMI